MANAADTVFKLNTGAEIPALGLGTWQSDTGLVKDAVSYALSIGYKHIDCAYVYCNEQEVGEGLKEAFAKGIKREDIFVTSKLWCTYHSRAEEALDKSLKSLGLDYLDLYLVHWPLPMNPNGNHDLAPKLSDGSYDLQKDWTHIQTWKSMEKLVKSGKVKAIGVSNYSKLYLEELLAQAEIVPAVNQIENHPSLPQQDVVDLCNEKGIHVTAYSPLGSTGTPLMKEPIIVELAEKKNVKPVSILLSYHLARGTSVLPKSVHKERIKENKDCLIFLDKEDMIVLNNYSDELARSGKLKRNIFPPFGSNFGFPDKL
ncbi:D-galacturonate reductase [Erysiphe necator]|uniref:Putative glycerol dehydrogenase n=1 Tax=Uncinula necator TaxID=52586 RepID=A0A0B1P3C5_UNCNE|nr:D-galacturonate reductase [Erysiphe necator]KHJ31179.1 putative glycerol dehydrogenase [Erysiphe necator]